MRINFKQEQIIEEFREDLEKHFPDVRFVEVTESWENPNDLWIHVISKLKNIHALFLGFI